MTTMTQSNNQTSNTKFNFSQPLLFSHLNGLALFVGSIVAYGVISGEWVAFILLLLVPDIAMLGYVLNSKVGAWVYNIGHSYGLAVVMMLAGFALEQTTIVSVGIILMAHIGMDQMVGYGYKYADAEFSESHMKRI
jgi:hypothetical protein